MKKNLTKREKRKELENENIEEIMLSIEGGLYYMNEDLKKVKELIKLTNKSHNSTDE